MKDSKRQKDCDNVLGSLRYYSGMNNLGYTHSKENGYQLVLYRDAKGSIERTIGRVCDTAGQFYDTLKTASDLYSITYNKARVEIKQ